MEKKSINKEITELLNMKKLFKPVLLVTALLIGAVSGVCIAAGQLNFALSLMLTAPLGLLAVYIQFSDILGFITNKINLAFVLRFIFRLACFAILLYVVLVKLKMSPLGCALGLTIPIFCTAGVLVFKEFRNAKKTM